MADATRLNVKQIAMTDHAYTRAAERFKLKDRNEALGVIRKKLQGAECFGRTLSEETNTRALMFANRDGEVFHLREDLSLVVTVYKMDKIRYTPLKSQVEQLHRKELRKLRVREGALEKRIEIRKLELDAELAQVKLRQRKTRSENVRVECENRIKEIGKEHENIKQMEDELSGILEKATQLSRFIVSLS